MRKMKANELRIGNYVHEPSYDECFNTYVIKQIKTTGCAVSVLGKEIQGLYDYIDLRPIPLTEKWLLDFGFIDNKMECGEYIMQVSANCFSGTLTKDMSWFISIIHVSAHQTITVVKQHVHQLQNLYFALTGEELIFKK